MRSMSQLNFYLLQIIDGVAYGTIYGLFALSIVLLYRANKIFNFAQTEIATLCVVGMVILLKYLPFWPAFVLTLILSFSFGALLHLCLMRFGTEKRKENAGIDVVISLILFMILNNVSAYLLGDDPQSFPSLFGDAQIAFQDLTISIHTIGTLATTLIVGLGIYLGFRFTNVGLKFEAVAENIVAARLRAISASNILAFAWGLAAMVATLGAMLIAPTLFVTPNMLITILAYALIAVVIGGLESPFGAIVGGIIVGVVENLATNISFIGSELKFAVVMALMLVVLYVRPRGLWGRAEARRV